MQPQVAVGCHIALIGLKQSRVIETQTFMKGRGSVQELTPFPWRRIQHCELQLPTSTACVYPLSHFNLFQLEAHLLPLPLSFSNYILWMHYQVILTDVIKSGLGLFFDIKIPNHLAVPRSTLPNAQCLRGGCGLRPDTRNLSSDQLSRTTWASCRRCHVFKRGGRPAEYE